MNKQKQFLCQQTESLTLQFKWSTPAAITRVLIKINPSLAKKKPGNNNFSLLLS